MADAFSGGSSWNDYLAVAERLRHLTREDVMAVCRKYFSDENYLRLHKKFGFYKKDKIAKPPYAPVRTADENNRSTYARRLAGLPTASLSPRTIDFSTAVERRSLGDNAMLYARSEERRVGKSVDLGGRRIIKKKKYKKFMTR